MEGEKEDERDIVESEENNSEGYNSINDLIGRDSEEDWQEDRIETGDDFQAHTSFNELHGAELNLPSIAGSPAQL